MEIAKPSALATWTGSALPSAKLVVAKPDRLVPETMDECRAIYEWVEHGRDVAAPTVSRERLSRHLEFLAATLPAKAVDTDTGKDRVAVYFRTLSGYSDEAIAYMAQRVCAELDWFPTPHQCLEILKDYTAPISDRETARGNCQRFMQEQMESFFERLQAGDVDQADIDAQPDQWKRIAENRWLLRQVPGGYVQRHRTIGADPAEAMPADEATQDAVRAEPTIADYVALGLTEQEAAGAISERQRLLRRAPGRSVSDAARDAVQNQRAA